MRERERVREREKSERERERKSEREHITTTVSRSSWETYLRPLHHHHQLIHTALFVS